MKIVVTGTRGIPNVMGGVETHCEQLCPRLARMDGNDVTVIRRSSYVHDGLSEWQGVRLVDIPTPRKKAFEAIIHTFRAVRAAKKMHADIVHINAIGPAMLTPYAKMLGMKVVFTHHGPDYDRDKWGRAAKMMLRFGERMGCRYADDVIVISDVIRSLVRDKYGREKGVHLIYNGVPEPSFCEFPEYFAELGIEPSGYVLGMSRFVPEKRLEDLVNAFVAWQEESGRQDIRLVLAGDADFEDEYSVSLKKLAREHNVILTGFVRGRKLQSLLSQARCYVLPSTHEGLPIALLEAMSYRLPVVVSDIPANLEVGLPREDYFRTRDVEDLRRHLSDKLSRPFAPTEYEMKKYDWDVIAAQVQDVYVAAMNKN